ncbi:MAG: hypothetical protein IJH61_07750 [Eubacteriaceae bacterium]|nr:hypothetical protein [Eubacteriaceae bacterium]
MLLFLLFGVSIISLICGILAFLIALVPGASFISLILAPLALITGVFSIIFGSAKTLGVGGIATGGAAIFLALILAFL